MKNKPQAIDESRRRLLGGAVGLGAAGVGLGAMGVQAAPDAPAADEKPQSAGSGYRETDHIRRYYRSAR